MKLKYPQCGVKGLKRLDLQHDSLYACLSSNYTLKYRNSSSRDLIYLQGKKFKSKSNAVDIESRFIPHSLNQKRPLNLDLNSSNKSNCRGPYQEFLHRRKAMAFVLQTVVHGWDDANKNKRQRKTRITRNT